MKIIVYIVSIGLMLSLLGCGITSTVKGTPNPGSSIKVTAPAPTLPTVTTEDKWIVTNSWFGNDSKVTENFLVTENTRINWETTNAQGIFQIKVQNSKGTLVDLPVNNLPVNVKGIGKDASYLRLIPDQYSLKINAPNTPWQITVEQQNTVQN